MKKLILLILIASLLTSCGAKPSGTLDNISGTDDTSSIEIPEIEETEPETTTEPATTTEETTEEVTETTIPEPTAEETTAEPVFDPENLMGGTLLCKGKDEPCVELCRRFNEETEDGRRMGAASELLSDAINSIIDVKEENDIDSLFKSGGTTALMSAVSGLDDFELICFLVVK